MKKKASSPATVGKTKSKTMKGLDSVTIRRADNGYVVSGWNDKANRNIEKVAKTKAELDTILSKIGIK